MPMSVIGPSFSGVVLMLTREGFWTSKPRGPVESGG
jgi:hypothetical protein